MGQQMAALLHGNRRDGPVGQDARGITAHMLRSVDCLSALLAAVTAESQVWAVYRSVSERNQVRLSA